MTSSAGLFIVNALASDRGVQGVPGGKIVWVEIATQS